MELNLLMIKLKLGHNLDNLMKMLIQMIKLLTLVMLKQEEFSKDILRLIMNTKMMIKMIEEIEIVLINKIWMMKELTKNLIINLHPDRGQEIILEHKDNRSRKTKFCKIEVIIQVERTNLLQTQTTQSMTFTKLLMIMTLL